MFEKNHEAWRRLFGPVEQATIRKKLQGKLLKQTERNYLSRSIRPKLRAAALVTGLGILAKLQQRKKDNTLFILVNIDHYGYSMLSPLSVKKKRRFISLEQLIAMILTEQSEARFIEAIPILLAKNRIEPFALLETSTKYGIKNKIGYLLETALLLKPNKYLKELLIYFKKNKEPELQMLVEGDVDFLLQTTPPRLRQWNLLGRFFDEDFKKLAKVYL